ncbi:hypothetical protein [Streptomyces sp. NPDC090029]
MMRTMFMVSIGPGGVRLADLHRGRACCPALHATDLLKNLSLGR